MLTGADAGMLYELVQSVINANSHGKRCSVSVPAASAAQTFEMPVARQPTNETPIDIAGAGAQPAVGRADERRARLGVVVVGNHGRRS